MKYFLKIFLLILTIFFLNISDASSFDAITHGKTGTGQTVSGDIWANVKADFEIPENPGFQYDQNSGTLTVTDQDGNAVGTITIPEKDREIFDNREPFTYVVEDAKGNIYTVTGDGNGNESSGGAIAGNKTGEKDTSGSDSSFNPGQLDTKDLVVTFRKSSDSRYAFDTWQEHYKNISLINNKNLYEHLGGYEVPCKLVPPGKTDVVAYDLQVIKKGGIDVSKLVFKTGTGYILKHDSISHELTLNGGNANDALDVYALYPDDKGGYQTVGKLKVLSYSERSFNLVLVPVNGNSPEASGIQTSLNSIFNPLGISWNVSQDENFKYPIGDIRSDGSGLLSQYPAELSALNSAYKKERGANKNTVYLFILGKASIKDADPGGFMPRGKQFGYLFTENGGGDGRTVAHEIGHGLFRLQHTFDGEYGREAAAMKGKTDNLMDYGGGTHLAKWQWDEIFSPALLVNPFEGDDDAMALANCNAPKPTKNGTKEAEKTVTKGSEIIQAGYRSVTTDCKQTWYYHTGNTQGWYTEEKYSEIVQPVIKGILIAQADELLLELNENELYDIQQLKLNYLAAFQNFYANENLDEDSFGTLLSNEIVSKAYSGLLKEINDIYLKRSGKLESISPEFELLSWGLGAVIKQVSLKIAKATIKGLSTTAFYTTVRNALGKAVKEGAEIGTKLEYLFGKATGSVHNIERSTEMLRQLESIGVFDNAAGRSLVKSHLENVYKETIGILQSNGNILRESLLMGPNGGLGVHSYWEGNKLITIILLGGK